MRKTSLLPLFLLCIFLTACGGSNIPCPFGPENLGTSPGAVTLTIENQTCTTICRVFIGAPSCDDWGLDLLQDGEVRIQHGSSYSFQVPPGRYDLNIEDCTETSYSMYKLDLKEDSTWTFSQEGAQAGAACEASLTVVNQSPVPICHMWIADPLGERFGNNWLENDETIPAGEALTFPVLPSTYDVKAEDCNFDQLRIEYGWEITDHQSWTVH